MPNFNAFMHRRNIFRKEPDFKKLACDYQELKEFMTVSSKNKLKFDFKNPDALRALTCALLHRYFQKRITIPSDRMIPAVPQRLNYICWIEDLVKLVVNQVSDLNVLGIDVGTGASCIFPILSCHRNPAWSFIGVEADQKSFSIAVENVHKNFMDDRISIVKIGTEDTLNDILCLSSSPVTFIMCNPPFFEEEYGVTLDINPAPATGGTSIGGLPTSAIGGCSNVIGGVGRPKSSANTSTSMESICSGGEIAFVGRLLEQSRHLKEEVTIYTSMLGRKQSLTHFKQTLSSLNEDNLSWTWAELCQGKTIRYAIAWSYSPGLDLTRAPPLRHGKNKSWKVKLPRKMAKRDCQLEMLENISFLRNLITRELMIAKVRVTRQTNQQFEMLIKTNDRTWTHQRRKRREQLMNKHKHQATPSSVNFNNSATAAASANLGGAHNESNSGDSHQMVCENVEMAPDEFVHATAPAGASPSALMKSMQLAQASGSGSGGDSCCIAGGSSSSSTTVKNNNNNNHHHHHSESTTTTTISMDLDLAERLNHSNSNTEPGNAQQVNMFANFINHNKLIGSLGQQLSDANNINNNNNTSNHGSLVNNDVVSNYFNSKKRKNPSSCSSSPSRVCPSPNDELTDDDNQSTDNSDNVDTQNEDSMNEVPPSEAKRVCKDMDDCENMDDIYDYLLCCRISLSRVCSDLYMELKLEQPCSNANDAYDLFQYFRNKLAEK